MGGGTLGVKKMMSLALKDGGHTRKTSSAEERRMGRAYRKAGEKNSKEH